jgi:hypothetical protein
MRITYSDLQTLLSIIAEPEDNKAFVKDSSAARLADQLNDRIDTLVERGEIKSRQPITELYSRGRS